MHVSISFSFRVNDGICDCCDGADEWALSDLDTACQNTCDEQGREARERIQRLQMVQKEGLAKKAELQVGGMLK